MPSPDTKSRTSIHEASNLHAAELILSDTERYGGAQALMVQWARKVRG